MHGLFAGAVRRDPDAVAVEYGERTLSYRELDRAAARVAGRLRALGLAPEARVGVWAERSPEVVAAMLGALLQGRRLLVVMAMAGVNQTSSRGFRDLGRQVRAQGRLEISGCCRMTTQHLSILRRP